MLAEILFSPYASLHIDSLEVLPDRVSLTIHSFQEVRCPDCTQPAYRIHSHYTRKFADMPWVGLAVRIFFCARRFFCAQPTCQRRTFTEQLPSLIAPFAQRTQRLAAAQRTLGFALGGEAGARAAKEIGMGTSPDTLLRLVRNAPEPEQSTPRVLGVDDWALKKGQTYATILIDVEQSRPIDLLPDRTPEALTKWLTAHPGVEIITRDRASAYAEAATAGAPQAVQVADRFHLLLNLRETIERFFDRHQADLRKVKLVKTLLAEPLAPKPKEKPALLAMTELYQAREKRRLARFDEVRGLKQQGLSRAAIAGQLQMSVNTVKRYLRADEFPIRMLSPCAISKADRFSSYLRQRWQAGCRSPRQLWSEIRTQGFDGSESSVRRWVARLQLEMPFALDSQAVTSPRAVDTRVLSSRQASWILLKHWEELKEPEQDWWEEIKTVCSPIETVRELSQQFVKMVKKKIPADLAGWAGSAKASGLIDFRNFALGLQRDFAAVNAALTLPWSNAATEGHVHRLKMIKRQMYGRANFDLLRKRVLLS